MSGKLLLISLITILIIGCSSETNPVSPIIPQSDNQNACLTQTLETAHGGRVLWGYIEWIINPAEETFEAIPLRSTEMHLNVSKFIDSPPTKFTFTNFSVDKSTNTIGLDVGITHPFPANPNLSGFDVRGILIGAGSLSGFNDPSIIMAGTEETHLINTDGLTRWWNPVEFQTADNIFSYRDGAYGIKNSVGNYTATLNGYKLFSDDLTALEPPEGINVANRAVFSAGSTNTRRYEIWFPVEDDKFVLRYNYAVDACWEAIPGYIPGEPVNVPHDFPIEANMPEAFRIDIETDFNSIYYVDDTIKGGLLIYKLKVFDWQGYLSAGDVADEIADVMVECPGCLASTYSGTMTDPGSGSKAYAEYEITIDGTELTASGNFDALITVISANSDFQPTLTGYSGTAPLASYESFPFAEISVEAPPVNQPPVAIAEADNTLIYEGDTVTFDATGSYDTDGEIISYEWDFDGDGSYGDTYDGGTDQIPEVVFNEAGIFTVDLKVTDDDLATDTLDTTIEITVQEPENLDPVAIADADDTEIYIDETVTFDATGSYDPDGVIVSYEWDFDDDDSFGDPYDGGSDIMPQLVFHELGQYEIDLKVTDDGGAEDTLDVPITIYVVSPENEPPVADAEIIGDGFYWNDPVEFDATASYDPDGTVVDWQWDFDGDGVYGDPIDGGTPDNPIRYFSGGTHLVDLKVTDNGGKSDTLDDLLEVNVIGQVIITLPEDQDYKSVTGYDYFAMVCDTPANIPVDYLNYDGPWDFTGHDYLPDTDNLMIFDPGDSELTDFVAAFPASTDYFTRYDVENTDLDSYLYLAEEVDYVNDLLYIHGHIERDKDCGYSAAIPYGDGTGGPIALQYPCTINTDEDWTITISGGSLPPMVIYYKEIGIGEGSVVVPFDGVWNTKALLTRTYIEVEIFNITAARLLVYKWTADDGKQVARLMALNTPVETNFDIVTYEITGESRLVAMNAVL